MSRENIEKIVESRIIPIVLALVIILFVIGVTASNIPLLAKIIFDLIFLVLLYIPYILWHFNDK
jgi:ammonia channel protein AmtB